MRTKSPARLLAMGGNTLDDKARIPKMIFAPLTDAFFDE